MSHLGSCHCGNISFEVEGNFDKALECNCSHCSRKGYLLCFVPKTDLFLQEPNTPISTYTFNKHEIKHHFCSLCGCAPFGVGIHGGHEMVAINVRCLKDFDISSIERELVDGKSL